MAIHFDFARQARSLAAHESWWAGTLNRPLVKLAVRDAHPGPAAGPILSQATCADFSQSPEEVVSALDAHLSRYEYLGDAFPMIGFESFGPGVLAAFCGARLDNSTGGVWFFPDRAREIGEIHIEYDPENIWVRRIKDIYRAGLKKWRGLVIMGMPDLGGVIDVAATFRGTQNLLMDLYDAPGEVLRVIGEIERAWRAAYEDLSETLAPQGMRTDWSGLLSKAPSYILQCDFCYMIGVDMFRKFVLPTLVRDCAWLGRSIYHLDGVGELNHLDDILKIEKLDAVQWVYGDGKPGARHWVEVYRRIAGAGKRQMIVGNAADFAYVSKIIEGGLYFTGETDARGAAAARAALGL